MKDPECENAFSVRIGVSARWCKVSKGAGVRISGMLQFLLFLVEELTLRFDLSDRWSGQG